MNARGLFNIHAESNLTITNPEVIFQTKNATSEQWRDYELELYKSDTELLDAWNKLNDATELQDIQIQTDECYKLLITKIKEASQNSLPFIQRSFVQKTKKTFKQQSCVQHIKKINKLVLHMSKNAADNSVDELNRHIDKFNTKLLRFYEKGDIQLPPITRLSIRTPTWFDKICKQITTEIESYKEEETNRNIRQNIECYNNILHEKWEDNNIKDVLNKVLNRPTHKVRTDLYVTENNITIDEPNHVKECIRQHYIKWHSKRETDFELLENSDWNEEFQPLPEIEEDLYKDIMNPITSYELTYVLKQFTEKAPGHSKITTLQLKHLTETAKLLLLKIINTALVYQIMPKEWLIGTIYPIPKGSEQLIPNIANTRPIPLLDIVLNGTTTNDPIFVLDSIMENAKKQNNELWIVFQDMKRAFDSVDPNAMILALRRIKIPESYIKLLTYIQENRLNCTITKHGLTDFYHPDRPRRGRMSNPLADIL